MTSNLYVQIFALNLCFSLSSTALWYNLDWWPDQKNACGVVGIELGYLLDEIVGIKNRFTDDGMTELERLIKDKIYTMTKSNNINIRETIYEACKWPIENYHLLLECSYHQVKCDNLEVKKLLTDSACLFKFDETSRPLKMILSMQIYHYLYRLRVLIDFDFDFAEHEEKFLRKLGIENGYKKLIASDLNYSHLDIFPQVLVNIIQKYDVAREGTVVQRLLRLTFTEEDEELLQLYFK